MSATPSEDRPSTGWFIVCGVKTNRVMYFTDDPDYQPVTEGDWYFVSHHLGDLPRDMTLRNCWSWRFNGGIFVHAAEPTEETAERRLVDSNRAALRTLLCDRIDELRKPLAPSCALGETLRAAKLAQARAYLDPCRAGDAAAEDDGAFNLLQSLAVARGLTLAEAAALIVSRHRDAVVAMAESERLRESFSHAIEHAVTNDDLVALRARLIEEVNPRRAAVLGKLANPMTPQQWDEPVRAAERGAEAARLRAQLREAVNARRNRIHAGYLDADSLLKHKAKLAQLVLRNGGTAPPDVDISMLAGFAQARNLTLEDAARLLMGTVAEAERILRTTERQKDVLLARIEAARTLRDFRTVSREIDSLGAAAETSGATPEDRQ